jgi:chromosome segregation ATPase
MCLSADNAEQNNVQQLQQENQRMCKQVETLSRDVVVLQEQLHDGEEERKHQLEYQTVLENVRSELEANHVIELVAEKEKCAAERTHVLFERAAHQRVEQELCREREQVRALVEAMQAQEAAAEVQACAEQAQHQKVQDELCREREQVRALVEAMQAQAAAAEGQACAEQAQHQKVQDELHANTDKAKEELARARAAVRELRKEVHAVRAQCECWANVYNVAGGATPLI